MPLKYAPFAASLGMALQASIIDILPIAAITIGDDAAKHMSRYEDEVAQAKTFVELLPPGRHDITSQRPNGAYNRKSENQNWFYAIGGYSSWGKGVATVTDGPRGREYVVDFEYKFYDRYNWDGGKAVTIAGITVTDAFMGEFHRQGIAQEFDCRGSFKRKFSWRKGDPIPKAQLDAPGGR